VNAEANLTTLKLYLSYDATFVPGFPPATGAGATINMLDLITVTGGTGNGTLLMSWDVDGTLTAPTSFVPYLGQNVSLAVMYVPLVSPSLAVAGWCQDNPSNPFSSCEGFGIVGPNVAQTVNLSIPFVFGVPLATQLQFQAGTGIGGLVDFFNTASLQALQVFDSNGTQIQNASVLSDSGFSYAVAGAPTSVPEPASLLLLGTGLLGMSAFRYRRRR